MAEENENIVVWKIKSSWDNIWINFESPPLRFRNLDKVAWSLELYPRGESGDGLFTVIKVLNDSEKKIECTLEWSLLDGNGSSLGTWKSGSEVSKSCHMDIYGPYYQDVFEKFRHLYWPNDTLTVRVRFWNGKGDFAGVEHISALSRLNVAEESFVWRIKEFSSLQNDKELITSVSLNYPNKRENFKLKFYINGSSPEDSEVFLAFLAEDLTSRPLKITIWIANSKQKFVKCREKEFEQPVSQVLRWKIYSISSRREIMEPKSGFLFDDELALLFHFKSVFEDIDGCNESKTSPYFTGTETVIPKNGFTAQNDDSKKTQLTKTNPKFVVSTLSEGIWQTSAQISDHQPDTLLEKLRSVATLQESFMSLCKDHTLSDFNLRSGDVTFPVHKAILSVRSPVFRSMFCSDMKEATLDVLDIPDLDVHCLDRMLTFLYTGRIERDMPWESAADLYYAADKYQVTTLKLECVSVLKSILTVSNVCETLELADRHSNHEFILTASNVCKMLELADRHSDPEFMSALHDFIVTRYDAVVLTEEWDAFTDRNAVLAGETMMDVYKRKRLREEIALILN